MVAYQSKGNANVGIALVSETVARLELIDTMLAKMPPWYAEYAADRPPSSPGQSSKGVPADLRLACRRCSFIESGECIAM